MTHPRIVAIAGTDWSCINLRAEAGAELDRLPFCLRILLENAIRTGRTDDVTALLGWLNCDAPRASVSFAPSRILMHDTTAVPALVDLAAMRDATFEHGSPSLRPNCPVDIVIDHSVTLAHWGTSDAMVRNHQDEIARHAERYAFLKWAGVAFDSVTVHPPGKAILHTLNLEHLATVVDSVETSDGQLLIPDTMIGTDSHTPMINALGVMGWGVGGLEAEATMLGHPMPVQLPDVIGVHLTGRLRAGVLATDLALHVTARLREYGVVGAFVEFHGPGVKTLSVGARAAVANMAPEYGATTGYFPIDRAVTSYLLETGRSPLHVARVEAFARATGLWGEDTPTPDYTDVISINMSDLSPSAAGPQRPHDGQPLSHLAQSSDPGSGSLPADAVAIAAITSCTATADLDALVTAALLAQKAAASGLTVPVWVKPSFAPGSTAMLNALRAAGLMDGLETLGFHAVAIGCTTCIGNSGPLTPTMADAIAHNPAVSRCAVLSGNRNFPGRIHPDITQAWLVSPPMVVAFALAGRRIDISTEALGVDQTGAPVHLADIWPTSEEITHAVAGCRDPHHTLAAYQQSSVPTEWDALVTPTDDRYGWSDTSTFLRSPPFIRNTHPLLCGSTLSMHLLGVFGDDVTTDHISPAGMIPRASAAAIYLAEQGVAERDLGTYAARRGNFEVMVRGTFTNPALANLLTQDHSSGQTRLSPEGATLSFYDAAKVISDREDSAVVIAGARYGQGSSRDWGAKAPALLGVRAVIAQSFERIHRSNLIGMGILPVVASAHWAPSALVPKVGDRIDITIPEDLAPYADLRLTLRRPDGTTTEVMGRLDCLTTREIDILCAGGIIANILTNNRTNSTKPLMTEAFV